MTRAYGHDSAPPPRLYELSAAMKRVSRRPSAVAGRSAAKRTSLSHARATEAITSSRTLGRPICVRRPHPASALDHHSTSPVHSVRTSRRAHRRLPAYHDGRIARPSEAMLTNAQAGRLRHVSDVLGSILDSSAPPNLRTRSAQSCLLDGCRRPAKPGRVAEIAAILRFLGAQGHVRPDRTLGRALNPGRDAAVHGGPPPMSPGNLRQTTFLPAPAGSRRHAALTGGDGSTPLSTVYRSASTRSTR